MYRLGCSIRQLSTNFVGFSFRFFSFRFFSFLAARFHVVVVVVVVLLLLLWSLSYLDWIFDPFTKQQIDVDVDDEECCVLHVQHEPFIQRFAIVPIVLVVCWERWQLY